MTKLQQILLVLDIVESDPDITTTAVCAKAGFTMKTTSDCLLWLKNCRVISQEKSRGWWPVQEAETDG